MFAGFFSPFQLEKATQLHSIDVGSEGSAFVEVLVGRSSAPDTYEVCIILKPSFFSLSIRSILSLFDVLFSPFVCCYVAGVARDVDIYDPGR